MKRNKAWFSIPGFFFLLTLLVLTRITCVSQSEGQPNPIVNPIVDPQLPPPPSYGNVACSGINDHQNCIQVASFNIENFSNSASNERKDKVAEIVNNNGLDVLGLQEIRADNVLDQVISRLTGGTWAYERGATGGGQRLAILYNRDLVSLTDIKELKASNTGGLIDDSRWMNLRLPLHARVTIRSNNQVFLLIVLHLKARSDRASCQRRSLQVADLDRWLESLPAGTDFVMLGDYNDRVNEGVGICSSIDTLSRLETDMNYIFLTDQAASYFSSSDYTNIPFTSTIDHILINRELFSHTYTFAGNFKADVVPHGDVSGISDHQPVFFWVGLQ